jgi:hypothetical protein
VVEGLEDNDQSLNIKINKRKMFSKPPIIPKNNENVNPLQKALEIKRAGTPDRNIDQQTFGAKQLEINQKHQSNTNRTHSLRPLTLNNGQ